MKNKYISPEAKVVQLESDVILISVAGEENDNPGYWNNGWEK